MSHNDYTKYARESKVEAPEAEVAALVTEVESPIEPPVEPTSIVEPPAVEPITEPARKTGRVIGCTRLNVRKAPKPRAEVICEIACDTEVEIDEENSTIDFYKICTASGIEGYCVKTYIAKNPQK